MALIARCLFLLCTAVPVTAMAWNPYDTDSARARGYGYGEDYGSPGYYGTPAQPPGWEQEAARPSTADDGRRSDEWGQSDWYAEDPRHTGSTWRPGTGRDTGYPGPSQDGYRYDAYDGYRGEQSRRSPAPQDLRQPQDTYGYGGYGIEQQQQRPREHSATSPYDSWSPYGMERDGGADWREPQRPSWEQRARPQYRFRDDPELDALTGRGQAPEGYRYRPLTERELERRRSDQQYPELRDRDLLPRGPWRSYEDEGTAFGYHPDGSTYERYYREPW